MPQFAVFIYDKDVPFEEIPAEILEAHGEVEGKIENAGGKLVQGFAAESPKAAKSVRGDKVTDGPFHDTPQHVTGFFVVEANDVAHAAELAKFVPIIDGGVEVRPLFGAPEEE